MRTKDRICNISALKHTFSTLCPSCCAAASCSPSAAAPGDANDSVTFTSTEPAALQPLCWVAALRRWHIKVKLDVSQGVSTRHVDFLNTILHYPNMKPPRLAFTLTLAGLCSLREDEEFLFILRLRRRALESVLTHPDRINLTSSHSWSVDGSMEVILLLLKAALPEAL